MNADEQVRLVAVREGRPLVEREVAVPIARQDHADPETCLQQLSKTPANGQHDAFFERAALAFRPRLGAAMAGIERHNPKPGRDHPGPQEDPVARAGR